MEITVLLARARNGDRDSLERVIPLVNDELRRIARARLSRERPGHTLQPTALIEKFFRAVSDFARLPRRYAWTIQMKTCLALLALMAGVLPTAAAVDADFGLVGITGFETARLNAFCDGSVVPTPCDITFEFHDINGRTLKQVSMVLQPETSGFVDFSVGAATFVPGRVEINPCFKILRGMAQASVEIFDNLTQRTRLLINWGDGAVARSAADVDFGAVAITRSDIARMGAFCEGDGSVVPPPCDIAFEFHDANGRVLKSARKSVPAGTGASFDLRYPETGSTERRVSIDPCWTVANGAAVLDLQTVDSFTGLTLTQAYPAAPVTSTLN